MKSVWPHVRAVLLTVVLFVQGVDAIPSHRVKPGDPWVYQAVKPVRNFLKAVVLDPLTPVRKMFGVRQGWGVFATPGPFKTRVHLWGRADGGEWELLYRKHDPRYTLMAPQLDFQRVRGVHSTPIGPRHERVMAWLGDEVFARRPDLDELRLERQGFRADPVTRKRIPKDTKVLGRVHR